MPEFSETAAQPVDASRSSGFPLFADSVQLLNLLLIDRSHRNGMDPLTSIGVEQRLGVGLVSFIAQPILSDKLCRKHDGLMSQCLGLATPEVGATAGFKQDDGRIARCEQLLELLARKPQMRVSLTARFGEGDLKDLLCEIDGDEITLAHGLLLSWDIQRITPECWHIAMPVKTREESISSLKYVPALRAFAGRAYARRLAQTLDFIGEEEKPNCGRKAYDIHRESGGSNLDSTASGAVDNP
jgi:hypothetical protein